MWANFYYAGPKWSEFCTPKIEDNELYQRRKREVEDKSRREIQRAQFSEEPGVAWLYSGIEKTLYGKCLLDDEDIRQEFKLLELLEVESTNFPINHPVWDSYNLLSLHHVEGMNLEMSNLTGIGRKVAVLRARHLQLYLTGHKSARDWRIYDHLLENWTEEMTLDILYLHSWYEKHNFRDLEYRVLTWIASRMVNPPTALNYKPRVDLVDLNDLYKQHHSSIDHLLKSYLFDFSKCYIFPCRNIIKSPPN